MHSNWIRVSWALASSVIFSFASPFMTGCAPGGIDSETEEILDDEPISAESEAHLESSTSDPPSVCDKDALQTCLAYKGGDACFPKWGCKKGDEAMDDEDKAASPGGSSGGVFATWYYDNYSSIVKETKKFHKGSYGCAATASTALKMKGFSIKQVKVTNELESQLKALGWKKVTDMNALKGGDMVFTDKATSNLPGTWSHVYAFQKYAGAGYAYITDNNGQYIKRNIGPGPRSKSILAYRAP